MRWADGLMEPALALLLTLHDMYDRNKKYTMSTLYSHSISTI